MTAEMKKTTAIRCNTPGMRTVCIAVIGSVNILGNSDKNRPKPKSVKARLSAFRIIF